MKAVKSGKLLNQRGNTLLFAVFAITAVAVLGTGIYFMTTTSTFSGLGANDRNRAYHLALAGKDYAVMKNLENTASTYPVGRDFTMSNGDKFRLDIKDDEITSTGIVKTGTPYEASQTLYVKIIGFSRSPDISFARDIQVFTKPIESKAGLITTNAAAGKVSLGNIGSTWENNFGALWYRGNAVQGDCTDGRCKFGTGFRAFFVFQINASGTDADGFTFAFFGGSAEDPASSLIANDAFSVGGDTDKGELMGYAGDSRLTAGGYLDGITRTAAGCPTPLACAAGRGIQPPKMAIEFDPKANNDPAANVCDAESRRDGDESPERNHAAYVFWGNNDTSYGTPPKVCDPAIPPTVGLNTYDDNRHNAGTDGSPSDPLNSKWLSDSVDPSYYNAEAVWPLAPDWLLNNTPTNIYAVRIEVTRGNTPNAGGNYEYTMKSWIKQCADLVCTNYGDASSFANTKIEYDDTLDPPTLKRTDPVVLTPALHKKFDTFFFGWTTAMGSKTQEILINRFRMNFRK